MTHVHITTKKGGGYAVTVDGVAVERLIYSHGFGVEFPEAVEEPPVVSMLVPAEILEIDLPDAVVKALRASESDLGESKEASA